MVWNGNWILHVYGPLMICYVWNIDLLWVTFSGMFFHLFPGSSHCQCTCINIAAVFFYGGVFVFHFSVSSSVLIINAYTLWGRHYIFHWNDYFWGGMPACFFGHFSSDVIFYFRVIYCTFHFWLWRALFSRVWSRVHKKRLFSPSFIIIIIFFMWNSDTNNNNRNKIKTKNIFSYKVQQQQGISVLIPFFSYHKNMMCTSRVSIFMYFLCSQVRFGKRWRWWNSIINCHYINKQTEIKKHKNRNPFLCNVCIWCYFYVYFWRIEEYHKYTHIQLEYASLAYACFKCFWFVLSKTFLLFLVCSIQKNKTFSPSVFVCENKRILTVDKLSLVVV